VYHQQLSALYSNVSATRLKAKNSS